MLDTKAFFNDTLPCCLDKLFFNKITLVHLLCLSYSQRQLLGWKLFDHFFHSESIYLGLLCWKVVLLLNNKWFTNYLEFAKIILHNYYSFDWGDNYECGFSIDKYWYFFVIQLTILYNRSLFSFIYLIYATFL